MNDRAARWVIGGAAALGGAALLPHAFEPLHPAGDGPLWARALYVGIGWSFIFGGLAAWRLRAENRTGKIMVVCGWLFWLALLIGVRVPVIWSLSSALQLSSFVLLVYLLIAFPEGRLGSRWGRAIVAGEALRFVVAAAGSVFYDPAAMGCPNCRPGLNIFLVRSEPEIVLAIFSVLIPWGIALYVALMVTMVGRWVRASIPRRRILTPLLIPAMCFIAAYLAYLVFQQFARIEIYEAPTYLYHVALLAMAVAMITMPIMFVVGLTRLRARRARVSDLVVRLGELPTPDALETALQHALGDPSTKVGIWMPEAGRYLGADGTTLKAPTDQDRAVTYLERHGEPLVMLIHDPALLDDPGLVDAVGAATRLAVENEKLQQELLQQLAEVHASRGRIVEAADEERKRIERNLHDGAQQRLVSLSLALRTVEAKLETVSPEAKRSLSDVSEELEAALAELRELARGMYPAVLSDHGLGAAIEALADRSRLPVEIDLEALDAGRLPEKIEATAYFVVCEALTNAAKHAQASVARVRASRSGAEIEVEVSDDGLGGADLALGSGLRGLADRVHALGGEIWVDSPPGVGTTVKVRLACA